MAIRDLNVQRFSMISRDSFRDVLERLHAAVGHADIVELTKRMAASETLSELHDVIQPVLGQSDLLEFMCLDHGEVVRKGEEGQTAEMVRLIIGNPLIMMQMVRHVPDAGSYAPVTILVDERPDGVHLSYDRDLRAASSLTETPKH